MKFLLQRRGDVAASASPYRIVAADGGEVAWANRFLDMQRVRGLNELSLRAYGHLLLHFIRWWDGQPAVEIMRMDAPAFTESTLIDYVRAQREELPKLSPETAVYQKRRAGRRCCAACSGFTSRRRCRTVLTACSACGGWRPADAIAGEGPPWPRICA
jgi:hypothetical protein